MIEKDFINPLWVTSGIARKDKLAVDWKSSEVYEGTISQWGNCMSQRGMYMYGSLLLCSVCGTVGTGLAI